MGELSPSFPSNSKDVEGHKPNQTENKGQLARPGFLRCLSQGQGVSCWTLGKAGQADSGKSESEITVVIPLMGIVKGQAFFFLSPIWYLTLCLGSKPTLILTEEPGQTPAVKTESPALSAVTSNSPRSTCPFLSLANVIFCYLQKLRMACKCAHLLLCVVTVRTLIRKERM